MKRRKYYPNNWQAIKDTPAKWFPPLEYEELEEWKVHGYVLPSSIFGIIRSEDSQTGVIEEYTYKSEYQARERVKKEMTHGRKITLCTMEGVWHVKPLIDFNNP